MYNKLMCLSTLFIYSTTHKCPFTSKIILNNTDQMKSTENKRKEKIFFSFFENYLVTNAYCFLNWKMSIIECWKQEWNEEEKKCKENKEEIFNLIERLFETVKFFFKSSFSSSISSLDQVRTTYFWLTAIDYAIC